MDECVIQWYSKDRSIRSVKKAGEEMQNDAVGGERSAGKILGAVLLVFCGVALAAIPLVIAWTVGRKILRIQWGVGKRLWGFWFTKTHAKMTLARWTGKAVWRLLRAV